MKLKALVLGIAIATASVTGTVSATGIPVVDVANLQQTIMQYANMVQQLTELQSQLKQAEQQYKSITGGRGMGNLSRTDSYIPKNWKETLASMDGGGDVGNIANGIRDGASLLNKDYFVDMDGTVKEGLDRSMKDAATGQALNAKVYDSSQDRVARLNDLANQVDSASDLKAVADLQARISIENGMLMNELIKLQSMNAMVENQRRVTAQKSAQGMHEIMSAEY